MSTWWDDPTQKLGLSDVKERLSKQEQFLNAEVEDIEEVYHTLVDKGFINKTLFNPRRTKTEYFWLFVIQLLLNIFALGIEIANEGAALKSANGVYYSWDVRGGTFVMGLVFLAIYYKKYHVMKNLIRFRYCGWGLKYCPIFCCCQRDQPMQAIPNDVKMNMILSEEELVKTKTTLQTQTSFVSNNHVNQEDKTMTTLQTSFVTNNGTKV